MCAAAVSVGGVIMRGNSMSAKQHFELLAQYNQWMNASLYRAAATLSPEERNQSRGAFFGSILGTLNHILVADITWLTRIRAQYGSVGALHALATFPVPSALNQILFENFDDLARVRAALDQVIVQFIADVTDDMLDGALQYRNMKGDRMSKKLSSILLHYFNHQTHHRGQVTALLSQAGVDYGVTDLVVLVPDLE